MRRAGMVAAAALASLFAAPGCHEAARAPGETLGFQVPGQPPRRVPLARLEAAAPPREVDTEDPYYRGAKRFLAIPAAQAVATGFGRPREELARESFILHARDGYAAPVAGSRLLGGDAYLAIDDLDVPGFAPIGPAQVSPAPVYLIWRGEGHTDIARFPRPWQLDTIAIADFETTYPHVIPRGEPPGGLAYRGLALFRAACIECHAINREGGRVGPDLNVPRNILEYRPEAQVRAYIRNPRAFRYGNMPPHPELTDRDLDALVAYLRAMGSRKYDPGEAT